MRSTVLVVSGTLAALVLAGIAAASAQMFGLGSADAPSTGARVVLHASVAPGIRPGTSRPVGLTASHSGSSAVAIRTVRLVRVAADAGHPACVTDDFTMAAVPQDASVPGDGRRHRLASGTLVYRNTDVDQSACEGATLTLALSSDARPLP
jgi:hypothetical protein